MEKDIRQQLTDNARAFHPMDRRGGVTLVAKVDGVTYSVKTSPKVWQIPAIESRLATMDLEDLAACDRVL